MIPRIFFDIASENKYEAKYEAKYDMAKPFVDDPWLIATDARIMVRMPAASLTFEEAKTYGRGTRKLLPLGRTIEAWNQNTSSLSKKSIVLPDAVEDREICRKCYPKGEWEWPFIPPSGRYCGECEGDGWNWIMEGIKLGPYTMNRKYISLLIRCGVSAITPGKKPNQAAYFKGDGFEGISMPFDPEKARAAEEYARKSAHPS
jgi:hypothetical protein